MASIHETLGAGRKGPATLVAADPPRRPLWRRVGPPALVAGGFAVFAAVVWLAWQDGLGGGEPPLVRAPAGPFKHPPDKPGIDEPAERRNGATRLVEGPAPPPKVERLLPREPAAPRSLAEADPELVAQSPAPGPTGGLGASAAAATRPPAATTTTPPAAAPATSASAAATEPASPPPTVAPVQPRPAAEPSEPVATEPPPPAPVRAMPVPPTAAAPPATAPVPDRLAAREPAPGRAAATPSTPLGPWAVQVAAVSSREAAERGWAALQARHPELLGPLRMRVQEARLANGLTLYRLQGLGFEDREAAARTCARLKAAGTECFVVGVR